MKILDTLWFTGPQGCLGITLGEDETTGERKAYIGIGTGRDAELDAKIIAGMGAKVMEKSAERLFNHFNP